MATLSFFARQDSTTAKNSILNPIGTNQAPTTTITFTDNGGTGDLLLDANGGLVDPDTRVIINGVTYNFTLRFTGTMPSGNSQVPASLVGKKVALISVVINGQVREYFFVTDGTGTLAQMNAIGNGSIPLDGLTFNPPPFCPCFCAGTMIATPSGPRAVETLAAGDTVLNEDGEALPILWVGKSRVSLAEVRANPNLAPIRIPAHIFGPSHPAADLLVSPQHRIVLHDVAAELLFGEPRVLAAARHLVGTFAEETAPDADVDYVHILTEAHEILLSNGLPSESFQPARRSIDVMAPETRSDLETVLQAAGHDDLLTRPDAQPSLKRGEVRALLSAMRPGAPLKARQAA
ncbi:Hint domain-containing protein [Tabrizicola sp. BL-A-41-H6]|uniref:Hint domain-containing protein n=1 Tax=Tabrizicola sp. BL-A-41-H6 TaxID=3421107 RepID=UPI003D676787